jgi:predicted GNAT superfamily acetyltransferase
MGRVTFKGDLKNNFRRFVREAVEPDLSARADRVVAAAQAKVPVKSGDLQRSIRKVAFPGGVGRGYRIIADARAPGADKSYALAVELGHITRTASKAGLDPKKLRRRGTPQHLFVAADPYMLPALEAAKDKP